MQYRNQIVVSLLTILALGIAAAIATTRLPAGAMLVVHWDAAGRADGWAPAGIAVLLPVAMAAGVSLLMAALPGLSGYRDRAEANETVYRTVWYGVLAVAVAMEVMIAGPAFGLSMSGNAAIAAVGGLLVLVGNALPKSRPNRVIGIRTPWTLTNQDVWIATHRVGSRVMIGGGILLIVSAFLPMGALAKSAAIISVILAVAVIPVSYSYRHRDQRS